MGATSGMRLCWPHMRERMKLADLPRLYRMLDQQAQVLHRPEQEQVHQVQQQHLAQPHQKRGPVPITQRLFDYLGLVVGVGPVLYSGKWQSVLEMWCSSACTPYDLSRRMSHYLRTYKAC